MTSKDKQVRPAPVHSDRPSGLGQAAGEIENPVRDFTFWARGALYTPHQQAEYKVASHLVCASAIACKSGGVHIRAGVRGINSLFNYLKSYAGAPLTHPPAVLS